ncbi:histidine kinase [Metabacillus halosaccharovorans]|uniref:histidine kinase n=1 Tax=Metabacillus halosaccharovorans TaxID=930124 RepID=UPI003735DC8E
MVKENKNIEDYDIFDNLPFYRFQLVFWVVIVFIAANLLQFLEEAMYDKAIIFFILMLVHLLLHWFSRKFKNKYAWPYLIIQCSIIFISAFIMPSGSPAVLIGLLPIIIAQSIYLFDNSLKVIIVVILLYLPYSYAVSVNYGIQELPFFIPILFFIMAIAIFYSILYVRQANAWRRMQYYLSELQLANQKIEELTIVNERKRIARDLHDTLAQGLAGLIMKLEAIDIHLQNNNYERARKIVQDSMLQSRIALKDAREAIDDLRSVSMKEADFVNEVEREIIKFTTATSMNVNKSFVSLPSLPTHIKKHSLYVISECLMNIAKHSKATQVNISIWIKEGGLFIEIQDDGVGFHPDTIGKKVGHYGLIGLNERIRILRGDIKITSAKGEGTVVLVNIPL